MVLHKYEVVLVILLSIAVGIDWVTCLKVETKASGIHAKPKTFDLFLVIAV